jgi:hypothetical protein
MRDQGRRTHFFAARGASRNPASAGRLAPSWEREPFQRFLDFWWSNRLKRHDDETVETVEEPLASLYTPLKQGVNESALYMFPYTFPSKCARKTLAQRFFVLRPGRQLGTCGQRSEHHWLILLLIASRTLRV